MPTVEMNELIGQLNAEVEALKLRLHRTMGKSGRRRRALKQADTCIRLQQAVITNIIAHERHLQMRVKAMSDRYERPRPMEWAPGRCTSCNSDLANLPPKEEKP